MSGNPTAFTKTAHSLRDQLREAVLDHDAFELLLRPCELPRCRATCCHDGAVLSPEEADQIRELMVSDPESFPPAAHDQAIVPRDSTLKTAVRPALEDELADDFPAHFGRTRCVFLDGEHKCSLQLFSVAQGHHPWFFKPISCWMHPILLTRNDDQRPLLTLRSPNNDESRFATCTPCGRADQNGQAAREALSPELTALSTLAERDFTGELNAPSVPE